MGFHRLHRNLKKLLCRKASTLVETLVAMTLIGIVGIMLASGITTALRFYTAGKQVRQQAEQARTQLYDKDREYNIEVMEHTDCQGEFFAQKNGEIVCYSIVAFTDKRLGSHPLADSADFPERPDFLRGDGTQPICGGDSGFGGKGHYGPRRF